MIRGLILWALCLWPVAGAAEGLSLSDAERSVFGREIRALLLEEPEIVERALSPAPVDPYAEAIAEDQAKLADLAWLFAPTPRGIGADKPRLTLVFFETFPCAGCAAAWSDLTALIDRHPDIRVEPRFASDTGTAQVLLSLLDHQGAEAYHAARRALFKAQTAAEVAETIKQNGWFQDRMYRGHPGQEAQAFAQMELEITPSYALPGLMLRGAMPLIVLEKYVTE